MQALISLNGVAGSNDDLPISTPVQLDNVGTGGESTYLWQLLAVPEGSAAVLTSTTVHNPLFTPDLEGTYLIQLVVNGVLPNRAIVGVRQLKTGQRIPAPGETTEDGTTAGWAPAVNRILRIDDSMRANPTRVVGTCDTGGLAIDTVAAQQAAITMPNGELEPVYTQALATSLSMMGRPLYIVDGGVKVPGPAAAGDIVQCAFRRIVGPFYAHGTGMFIGDPVYVSDTGTLALLPGTFKRRVGFVVHTESAGPPPAAKRDGAPIRYGIPGGTDWWCWFDGTACAHLDETQAFSKSQGTTPVPLSIGDGGVVTIDAALSNMFTLTLTESVYFDTPINMYPGWSCSILVTQDGTGGWVITASPYWCVGSGGTFTLTPGHSDVVTALTFEGVYLRVAMMSDRTYSPPA